MYAPAEQKSTPPRAADRLLIKGEVIRPARELIWIACVTFLAVAVPVLLYYRRFHLGAVFYFIAGDMFYYLDVVRYSRNLPFFSFDGIHPTNGFHPLWQVLLSWLCRLRQFPVDTAVGLGHIFVFNALLVSAGYALLSIFLVRRLRFPWLAPIALCPGFVWFAMSIADSNYLSSWSYINGMESGLSLFLFGLLLLVFCSEPKPGWRTVLASVVLGLAVLARLDDVFYLLAFLAYSLIQSRSRADRVQTAARYAPPFLMIGTYLLYNHHSVGRFLPVSGAIKDGFALLSNIHYSLALLLPSAWEAQPRELTYSMWSELAMRVFQLWLPIILCGMFLWVALRRNLLRRDPALACLCLGSFLKGLYDLFFVPVWNQGNWYYPIGVFTCNVLLALSIDWTISRALPASFHAISGWSRYTLETAVIGVFVWIVFSGIVAHKVAEHFSQELSDIYAHGPQIADQIRATGSKSYLEVQDGIIAYSTGIPSTSGMGLTSDPEALKARQEGRFFDLMQQRGVDIIVAGGLYQDGMDIALNTHNLGLLLFGVKEEELRNYRIEPEPRNPETLTRIYRIVRTAQ